MFPVEHEEVGCPPPPSSIHVPALPVEVHKHFKITQMTRDLVLLWQQIHTEYIYIHTLYS